MSKEKLLDQQQRLFAIREHLKIKVKPESPDFADEVSAACFEKVRPVIERNAGEQGEKIINAVAFHLGVRFEEVTSPEDIARIENKYLVEQKELGFGVLSDEISRKDVDALLFQRMHAHEHAPDRWVAVLNLQESRARAYWSKPHELTHRIVEPPQRRLPFFRHKSDYENQLERLIDLGAASLAFPRVAFGPVVEAHAKGLLTWDTIKEIGQTFAPTTSLQSVAKAVLNCWQAPAVLLIAQVRPKRNDPFGQKDLRISLNGFSPQNQKHGVMFFENMRVPMGSAVMRAYREDREVTELENLRQWVTSQGSALPDRKALVSAISLQNRVYALISPQ